MWCVVVCDLETLKRRMPWPALGRSATRKKILHHKYTDSIIFVIHAYEEQEELRKRGEFGHMGQKIHLLIWRL